MTWVRYTLSLAAPASTLAFVVTGPHSFWVSLALLPTPVLLVLVDLATSSWKAPPEEDPPGWPFDLLLVVHAVFHFAVLALYLRLARLAGIFSADVWVGAILVGHNSGLSGVVVAHELVHRRSRVMRTLGRALLCTVFYEHFATEHLRGHHVRVATHDDPATARFGESLVHFRRRTIPAQFISAWRIECRRLGDERMRWCDPRLLRSRVVPGLLVELVLLVATAWSLGPAAVVALIAQAVEAVSLLESVNYVEHWGLTRSGRVREADSWDTDSAFSRYFVIGLARHADHHAHANRPWQTLRRTGGQSEAALWLSGHDLDREHHEPPLPSADDRRARTTAPRPIRALKPFGWSMPDLRSGPYRDGAERVLRMASAPRRT